MPQSRRVVLYGNSLFMAGVAASLQRLPGLEVVRRHTPFPDTGQQLDTLRPDAIIVELTASPAADTLAFLQAHPGIPLITLDPNSREVVTLSSQQIPARTASELAHFIENQS
jgi:hypothetical protein